MPGAFCEAVTVGETFDNAQKPRAENFRKVELEADHLLFDGSVELLFTVSRKPSLKRQR